MFYGADGQEAPTCDGKLFENHFLGEALDVWVFYQKGLLPYAGGFYDQPNLLIEAIGVIDSAYAKHIKAKYKAR